MNVKIVFCFPILRSNIKNYRLKIRKRKIFSSQFNQQLILNKRRHSIMDLYDLIVTTYLSQMELVCRPNLLFDPECCHGLPNPFC